MKFHLLPGSKVAPQTTEVKEYAWVTKQEMEGLMTDKDYFTAVKDMLSDY